MAVSYIETISVLDVRVPVLVLLIALLREWVVSAGLGERSSQSRLRPSPPSRHLAPLTLPSTDKSYFVAAIDAHPRR